jgi:hypothetical protein
MSVEIGTETPIFLFWEYLFQNFGMLSLQCGQAAELGRLYLNLCLGYIWLVHVGHVGAQEVRVLGSQIPGDLPHMRMATYPIPNCHKSGGRSYLTATCEATVYLMAQVRWSPSISDCHKRGGHLYIRLPRVSCMAVMYEAGHLLYT